MFFKNSRYRKLPDEVTIDRQGRQLVSKSVRLLPKTTGIFQHTLEDRDRLDHLAQKYYNQPRKWWRICDANPEFIAPQALLGKTPWVTQQFPISFRAPESDPTAQPPWALLIREIANQVGVQDVWLTDDENYLIVIFNQVNVHTRDLTDMIERIGFIAEQPQTLERTGKSIIIPPDSIE